MNGLFLSVNVFRKYFHNFVAFIFKRSKLLNNFLSKTPIRNSPGPSANGVFYKEKGEIKMYDYFDENEIEIRDEEVNEVNNDFISDVNNIDMGFDEALLFF